MTNRRRAQKRPYNPPRRTLEDLLRDAAEKPATQTAKPRRTPRKVKRREDVNRGISETDLETLGQLHWFLVRVPSTKEIAAERILTDHGLTAFAPVETRFRRKNGVVKGKEERKFPLVPGYLLVGFAPAARMDLYPWAELFRFRLVTHVIGHQGCPIVLPFGQVRRLIVSHSAGDFVAPAEQRFMQTGREFRRGDRVEVLDGLYEGHVSEVTEIKGQTARMLLTIFGCEREVEVPLGNLGRVA